MALRVYSVSSYLTAWKPGPLGLGGNAAPLFKFKNWESCDSQNPRKGLVTEPFGSLPSTMLYSGTYSNPFRTYPIACLQPEFREGRTEEAFCRRSLASIQRSHLTDGLVWSTMAC